MPQLTPFVKKSLSDVTKEYLLKYIKEASCLENPKLPSEVEIANHLSVSRVTVRRALSELESEGLIFRIHGKGTFVNTQMLQINLNLSPARSFFHLISESGYHATVRLLQKELLPPSPQNRTLLGMDETELLVRLDKLFYANDKPSIYCIDLIPQRLIPAEPPDAALEGSTLKLIYETGGRICMRDSIEFQTYSREEMAGISGGRDWMECDSVLAFDTVTYDQDNRPLFLCRSFYNTGIIRFNMMRSYLFSDHL